ncbi:hypothetical protein CEXT_573801, partial [Caerostris extrusa]
GRINEEALRAPSLNQPLKTSKPLKKNREIRDLLYINKLDEEKLEEEIGIEKSLKKSINLFLEEFEKQDLTRTQRIQAIQNVANDLSQHEVEPDYSLDVANIFDRAEDIFKMHFDEDLNTSFIKK